jgi:hypothetical protein
LELLAFANPVTLGNLLHIPKSQFISYKMGTVNCFFVERKGERLLAQWQV